MIRSTDSGCDIRLVTVFDFQYRSVEHSRVATAKPTCIDVLHSKTPRKSADGVLHHPKLGMPSESKRYVRGCHLIPDFDLKWRKFEGRLVDHGVDDLGRNKDLDKRNQVSHHPKLTECIRTLLSSFGDLCSWTTKYGVNSDPTCSLRKLPRFRRLVELFSNLQQILPTATISNS